MKGKSISSDTVGCRKQRVGAEFQISPIIPPFCDGNRPTEYCSPAHQTVPPAPSRIYSSPAKTVFISRRGVNIRLITMLLLVLGLFFQKDLLAQPPANPGTVPLPKITLDVETAKDPEDFSITLQLIFLMTILSLAPAILIMLTSFTRIIIVFHFIRQALGTQQIPPNQVLIGLALFMTFLVMAPTWNAIHDNALRPYLDREISQQEAYEQAMQPIREFLLKHTREKDLALFVKLIDDKKPDTPEDISTLTLVPAFAISELRVAFQIGFIMYIPFLIIDMVVASVLMSMGMMMLPPMMISLPFKLLLFVLVDGWYLLVSSLMNSF